MDNEIRKLERSDNPRDKLKLVSRYLKLGQISLEDVQLAAHCQDKLAIKFLTGEDTKFGLPPDFTTWSFGIERIDLRANYYAAQIYLPMWEQSGAGVEYCYCYSIDFDPFGVDAHGDPDCSDCGGTGIRINRRPRITLGCCEKYLKNPTKENKKAWLEKYNELVEDIELGQYTVAWIPGPDGGHRIKMIRCYSLIGEKNQLKFFRKLTDEIIRYTYRDTPHLLETS